MRIKQLPSWIANQIAAGEVIERPASVIKELIENAADANARRIVVEVYDGGMSQMAVHDDGMGILAEDLPLAIAAHATSKVASLEDFNALSTLGFRGEALASIASISKLTLRSKSIEEQHASQLVCNDQSTWSIEPVARAQGTSVIVSDLFYNAPVRKKFLKALSFEYQAIEAVFRRFALSSPHLELELHHQQKCILKLPAALDDSQRQQRIKKILGKTFWDNALAIEAIFPHATLSGYVTSPQYQRSQTDKQFVYLNQRMIKDKLIYHAIKQAYADCLHPGRFPGCVLYLTLDPRQVDVNVHPTKHEVRFGDPRFVHDLIYSTIKTTLEQYHLSTRASSSDEKMQIKKIYPQETRYLSLFNAAQNNSEWLSLNAKYILVFIDHCPYLIDLKRVYQESVSDELANLPRPLETHTLVMPIRLMVNEKPPQYMTCVQEALYQLGVVIDHIGERQWLIRSVPKLFLHLDCKAFVEKVIAHSSIMDYEKLFVEYLVMDIQTLDEDSKKYWLTQIKYLLKHNLLRGIKPLDLEHCEAFLNA